MEVGTRFLFFSLFLFNFVLFQVDTLDVNMEVRIASFDAISEVNMDYTVTIYLNQFWKDERLVFGAEDEYLTLMGDFAEHIWLPDTFVANDKYSYLHDVTEKNKMIKIYGNGNITYGMRFHYFSSSSGELDD